MDGCWSLRIDDLADPGEPLQGVVVELSKFESLFRRIKMTRESVEHLRKEFLGVVIDLMRSAQPVGVSCSGVEGGPPVVGSPGKSIPGTSGCSLLMDIVNV